MAFHDNPPSKVNAYQFLGSPFQGKKTEKLKKKSKQQKKSEELKKIRYFTIVGCPRQK